LEILGIESPMPMDETSSGAGGAVGGFSGPFGQSSQDDILPHEILGKRDNKKKKKKKKKNESVDLSVVDEVFKLLNERGIIS
jgi:hypothetical protein